jgi:hypothetical protein
MTMTIIRSLTASLVTVTHMVREAAVPRHDDRERGDVPGWVLITLMTAGLVTALWALAGPQLNAVFTDAISSVTGP